MLDIRDPAIKLFGKTIPVLSDEADEVATIVGFNESSCESVDEDSSSDTEKKKRKQNEQRTAATGAKEDKQSAEPIKVVNSPSTEKEEEPKNNHQTEQEKKNSKEEPKPNNVTEEDSQLQEDTEKEQDDGKKNPQERTLKKPDKIIPCPRCNSMETKFCYYNNYNVNQPRHFCKSCQRYWTAGGTMRNIPIGAGRRKNKSSGSRYCQISVSDALQAAQIDLPNGTYGGHHPVGFKANGTVLTFGGAPDSALCDSMASVLNLTGEKKDSGATKNEFHKSEHQIPVRGRENGDDRSTASSTVTTSASADEGGKISSSKDQVPQNLNGFAHQIPCFSGFQWPYGWNPCVPFPPGFCPPAGIPMPFYPPPYWNGVAPIPWNVPWASSSCAPGSKSPSSNPSSPLGKHSRNGETLRPNDPERSSGTSSVLVPKTLRIDDPEEAAKSSIWATLGIKKEKVDSAATGGFFKGLQSKKLSEEKNDHQEKIKSSPVFKANPAAFARSISLREGV